MKYPEHSTEAVSYSSSPRSLPANQRPIVPCAPRHPKHEQLQAPCCCRPASLQSWRLWFVSGRSNHSQTAWLTRAALPLPLRYHLCHTRLRTPHTAPQTQHSRPRAYSCRSLVPADLDFSEISQAG